MYYIELSPFEHGHDDTGWLLCIKRGSKLMAVWEGGYKSKSSAVRGARRLSAMFKKPLKIVVDAKE